MQKLIPDYNDISSTSDRKYSFIKNFAKRGKRERKEKEKKRSTVDEITLYISDTKYAIDRCL
jgi:hypothetical protein